MLVHWVKTIWAKRWRNFTFMGPHNNFFRKKIRYSKSRNPLTYVLLPNAVIRQSVETSYRGCKGWKEVMIEEKGMRWVKVISGRAWMDMSSDCSNRGPTSREKNKANGWGQKGYEGPGLEKGRTKEAVHWWSKKNYNWEAEWDLYVRNVLSHKGIVHVFNIVHVWESNKNHELANDNL